MNKNILVIIPARGGSKGIPQKNIRNFNGKPLIMHAVDTALQSKYVNRIVVSTDDSLIENIAKANNVEVVNRPQDLATDTSLVIDSIRYTIKYLEEVKDYKTDIIVLLECTSPIKSVVDIDNGIKQILDAKADSATAFIKSHVSPNRMWKINGNIVKPYIANAKPFLPRQSQPAAYELTGQFYALSSNILFQNPQSVSVLLGKVYPIISTTKYTIDIDEEIDFILGEEMLKQMIKYENVK